MPARIILLMGVAGAGKTTIGRQLSTALGWPYYEADDFHSPANKEKMSQGTPLNDTDREPWLTAIRAAMDDCRQQGRSAVFSCSALKESYRSVLLAGTNADQVSLVFLSADRAVLLDRMKQREGHYMKPAMLESQLAILEPPSNALVLAANQSPENIVAAIRQHSGD